MAGKLYGIGVGPGDPELLTLKAVRLIRECHVLAVPGVSKEDTQAYRIAVQAVPQAACKECLELEMPMTRDEEKLAKSHGAAFALLRGALDQGKNVAYLTLGDPCIYSTYLYMHQRASKAGYTTEIVNGIPSFCAVSARLNQGLVEKSQTLHIIPSAYDLEEGLKFPGTRVLMKAGKKLSEAKRQLLEEERMGKKLRAAMVENCGMPKERIIRGLEELPAQAGYYTSVIVKEEL